MGDGDGRGANATFAAPDSESELVQVVLSQGEIDCLCTCIHAMGTC